jgi:hypothetical protein
MTQSEDIRDLFARYAAEVGNYLPASGRADIEREIAATLADRLDDRMKAAGRTAALNDAMALLKETGHPAKTASSYLTHGYIVGPSVYPLFLLVCRVALPVLGGLLIGALALSKGLSGDLADGFLITALGILGTAATGVLQAFAVIVIVFAIIERVDSARRAVDADTWDPRLLPKNIPGAVNKVSDQVVSIVLNTVFIVFLVFLERLVEPGIRIAGPVVIPLGLTDGLRGLLPFFIFNASAEIMVAIFLLTRRMPTVATLAARVSVKIFGIVASGLLLTAWPFVLIPADAPAAAALGIQVLREVIRVGCILGIVFGSIDVVREILRFRRARPASAV